MGKPHALALALVGILVVLGWFLVSRALDPERRAVQVDGAPAAGTVAGEAAGTGAVGGPVAPADPDRTAPESAVVDEDVVYTPADVAIFDETMAWARQARMDTLPLGEIVVRVGQRFVGEPYTPHTLDLGGAERVVVNLREFDCVTYVESVLALSRMIRDGDDDFATFPRELRRIRYRDGVMDGYASRLHYFSEWIADNAELGLLRDVTGDLGGRPHDERIDFMTSNVEAYAQLEGFPDRVEKIREVEQRLSRRDRAVIPEDEVAAAADGIRNGDIIAATSSVRGLDVAHTGFALWRDGRLLLMHAPLIGEDVQISDRPLADRILRIDGQDGIMVARPL